MLFVSFQLGDDRYAIEAKRIFRVLPLVAIKRIPGTPAAVAGALSFQGFAVPVIDLSELALGRPAARILSTRILLAHYRGANEGEHLLGLLAEKATDTLVKEPEDFADAGVTPEGAPYLGPVATHKSKLVQRIDLDRLLPDSLKEILFTNAAGL